MNQLTRDLLTFSIIFLFGLLAILLFPVRSAYVLVLAVPVVAVLALMSAAYLGHIYREQDAPKPVLFTMLLGATVTKTAMGAIIGYIAAATLLRQQGFDVPYPSGSVSALVALIVSVLVTPPIFYAARIYFGRRRAS